MKTTETRILSGLALDYYVAMSQGHVWRCAWMMEKDGLRLHHGYENGWGNPTPPYSTDWSAGGPVIEKEHINIFPLHPKPGAQATFVDPQGNFGVNLWEGDTMLIAAMRAVVAKHYGEHVPELKP